MSKNTHICSSADREASLGTLTADQMDRNLSKTMEVVSSTDPLKEADQRHDKPAGDSYRAPSNFLVGIKLHFA